jgi:hypothetical protein
VLYIFMYFKTTLSFSFTFTPSYPQSKCWIKRQISTYNPTLYIGYSPWSFQLIIFNYTGHKLKMWRYVKLVIKLFKVQAYDLDKEVKVLQGTSNMLLFKHRIFVNFILIT